MTLIRPFAIVVMLALTGGCATERATSDVGPPTVLTQRSASDMASCIGQALGVAPTASGQSLVVEAAGGRPSSRYVITRDEVETVVILEGEQGTPSEARDQIAIGCALRGD